MTLITDLPCDNNIAVPGRDRSLTQEREAVHLDYLVLLCGVMTFVTVDLVVHALRPHLVCIVMHMAGIA